MSLSPEELQSKHDLLALEKEIKSYKRELTPSEIMAYARKLKAIVDRTPKRT